MSVKYSYDKANNYYYLRKNGKKIASATTEEALTEKLMQLGKESEIIPISTLTVRDAINSFLPYSKETHEQNTYESYKYQLEYHIMGIERDKKGNVIIETPLEVDDKPIIDLKLSNIDEFIMKRIYETLVQKKQYGNKPVSLTTIHHIYTGFKRAITYIYLKNKRNFAYNPAELFNVKRKRKQIWCPDKSFAQEVLTAVDTYCNPANALYTHLCALGLRASEVVPLKVSDFKLDIDKPFIKIDRVMSQKNVIKNRVKNDDEERFVYIGKNLADRVKSFVIGKAANDWLFPSEKHVGKPRSHQAFVKHGIKRALKKIGKLDQWQGAVHVLRHYYASIIIEVAMKEKKSFKWIPKQLGHSQVSTTMEIYGHLVNPDDNDIGDVIEESLLG